MNEIKCPNCHTIFSIDEDDYNYILNQVKNDSFNKDLKIREEQLQKDFEHRLKESNFSKEMEINNLQNQITNLNSANNLKLNELANDKDKKILELQNQINHFENTKKVELSEALRDKEEVINKLNQKIIQNDSLLQRKDEEIQSLKDYKLKQSTKMIGESLEQYCLNEFNKQRSVAYRNAYFEKDNDIKDGTKGDFIFRDYDDGLEYISIMFEMKNEADETDKKHKNEDFLKKLDSDRNKKKCEYAILVSTLEADNDYYNQGIVDLSYRYPKMYVVRPMFFMTIISILKLAAEATIENKRQLEVLKNQDLDLNKFEENMNNFKMGFQKNYETASKKFNTAIEEIDKAIANLTKVKDNLLSSNNQLRLANDKAQELSIKKLTKNAPSLKEKFDEMRNK